jgi:hypothetical protein
MLLFWSLGAGPDYPPPMSIDEKIAAVSVDAKWIADNLTEFGFTMELLEGLYPTALEVANEYARRGDARIGIDMVTSEVKRRIKRKFSNNVRPFIARMLRDREPALRDLIKVSTTSRGRNRNLKVALDYLNVVAVEHQAPDGTVHRIALADVPVAVDRLKQLRKEQAAARRAEAPVQGSP